MISCTEFIPAYSELFHYLDETFGREEIDRYWATLFKPDGKGGTLITALLAEGIHGCWTHWTHSLNEEAADFAMYLNEKRGFFYNEMFWCPSKGKLLKLQDEIGLKPYPDYCLHCDGYRLAVEKAGLKYIYNFIGTDKAACSMLIYDPEVFDGRVILDEDTLVMRRNAADNEYFHPSFHFSLSRCVHYIGENYGIDHVRAAMTRYTKNALCKTLEAIPAKGLAAIRDKIVESYELDKAPDAVRCDLTDNSLNVTVNYCPAIKWLVDNGKWLSPWFRYTTECVMEVLAEAAGAKFEMLSYDEQTGACAYRFTK